MAAYTPPAGNAVNFDFSGSYAPPAGNAAAFNFGADLSVGVTLPDATQILTTGKTYYRRLVMPTAIEITTIMFEVAATVPTAQVVGKLYSDSSGAIGSLLLSSGTQTGTVADFADDLVLSGSYAASAGQAFWVAITITIANVNGKVKGGGQGNANGVTVPDAYAIWLRGNAIQTAVPLLSMGQSLSIAEGNSGTTVFSFDVTRQLVTSGSTTVDWAVTGTGSAPANASDFVGGVLPSGTITFAVGDTLKQAIVNVAGNTTVEPDETFLVTLSNPSGGATIGIATATGTILNDDFSARRRQILF